MHDLSEAEKLLSKAVEYRQSGFEGRARVTARLAVASSLRSLYQEHKELLPAGSALDLIRDAARSDLLSKDQKSLLEHFTLKVDEEYNLPKEIDLVTEAAEFVEFVNIQLNGANQSMSDNPQKIKIYATSWCGGSRRARNIFDTNHIDYEWIDIDENVEAGKFVESVNRGYRSVPTIVFPDGTILTEPSSADLMKKLGLSLPF
ncbi:MAG: glutaredoxin domain-containing protein [Anaerolineaceae bacterium]|jgi:mycoredoxin